MRVTRERIVTDASGRVRRVVRVVNGQPGVLRRLALSVFIAGAFLVTLVVLIPLLVVAFVVFLVLSLVETVRGALAGGRRRGGDEDRDERENVRVIPPRE